ncbi:HAD family hydrolase [Hespellia stercorisuis]|uniref:Haloacid dehalogenase superfamily, subfamily IA, variant 3 with third motif having DD or ED n=1 Tax=Hespellia stercorisuis DSM 15480 TaxID=1121950 RepID=A0A1M6IK04_9FIRM|nr:HAD family phosphatase [Hespellia stercorisuis]SHJ34768.1 haloacid dehalogenase superfamily, subfamily IA, variant 3 with third motif having DD or ED [Hespellia stercorisuis DSM 15480]
MKAELRKLMDSGRMEGVIFDMDGVLLDSMSVWDHAGEHYLQSMGISPEPQLGTILLEMNMEQGARYLKEQYQLEENLEQIMNGINRTVRQAYEQTIPLKQYVPELLRELGRRGIRMAVATSSDREIAEAALKRLEIASCFEGIFPCSEYETSKREPLIFEKAREKMKTECTGTWVFEDSVLAASTAQRAGFGTVGVFDESSRASQGELQNVCDYYLTEKETLAARL